MFGQFWSTCSNFGLKNLLFFEIVKMSEENIYTYIPIVKGGSENQKAEMHTTINPPIFSGKGEVSHFFVKIRNYFDHVGISQDEVRIRVLTYSLEEKALDLFLSLHINVQCDLVLLEEAFLNYFQPKSHKVVETQALMRLKKEATQSISEYFWN